MAFDVGLVLTWILFLALFPMAFFWLRRSWRIFVKRDFSEVALKRGQPPPDAERWAPYEGAINAVVGVVFAAMPYQTWTAIAGSTIWCKLFASFALGRHAHVAAARRLR
jgi:hypothetical protein